MTGRPDDAEPLVPIELSRIRGVRYRVYPIADHVADKVCALLELHPERPDMRRPALATVTSPTSP